MNSVSHKDSGEASSTDAVNLFISAVCRFRWIILWLTTTMYGSDDAML